MILPAGGMQALERLGRTGVVGIALVVFSASFWAGTLGPAAENLANLQALADRLAAGRSAKFESTQTPQGELAAFYAMLPGEEATAAVAGRMFDVARSLGIALRQGSYRLAPEADARFARYEVTYQTQAAYYRVRLLIRDLLREMPSLALEDISFERQQPNASNAEITMKFTLYVRRK